MNKACSNPVQAKAPTQNEQKRQLKTQSEVWSGARVNIGLRTRSELRARSKKEGCETPQKIYASFCEMKPIVLKNQPPSFGDYNCPLFFVFIKRGLRRGGAVPVEGSIIGLSFHSHVLLVEPEDQER